MAWTGTATVKQVTDKMFRVTGLSLAKDASGTIGFSDKTVAADVSLVAPTWKPYADGASQISLQDAIKVSITITTDVTTPVPISVVKTGTTHGDFVITFHNDTDASTGATSGVLEIWIQYHD